MLIIAGAIAVSGLAIYNTACFLVAGTGDFDAELQHYFNRTLFGYLWFFIIIAAVAASVLHFFLTRRMIQPIRNLSESTEQLKQGHYPDAIKVKKHDEIGQLVQQYNGLIQQLKANEEQRNSLISDLSHEIRTPLSNLNGYLLALKDGDLAGDKALFSALYDESNRLHKLVGQLDQLKEWDNLSANKITSKEQVNIREVLEQSAAVFQWTLDQRNITIESDTADCHIPIHVEGVQQVLSNLLDNAIRYYEGTDPILLTGEVQGSNYLVKVTGPGSPIPFDEQENIFKRFYRLDSSRSRDTGGSGLGLAITKKIIEQTHHGHIGIETTGDSNTFWFTLPLEK